MGQQTGGGGKVRFESETNVSRIRVEVHREGNIIEENNDRDNERYRIRQDQEEVRRIDKRDRTESEQRLTEVRNKKLKAISQEKGINRIEQRDRQLDERNRIKREQRLKEIRNKRLKRFSQEQKANSNFDRNQLESESIENIEMCISNEETKVKQLYDRSWVKKRTIDEMHSERQEVNRIGHYQEGNVRDDRSIEVEQDRVNRILEEGEIRSDEEQYYDKDRSLVVRINNTEVRLSSDSVENNEDNENENLIEVCENLNRINEKVMEICENLSKVQLEDSDLTDEDGGGQANSYLNSTKLEEGEIGTSLSDKESDTTRDSQKNDRVEQNESLRDDSISDDVEEREIENRLSNTNSDHHSSHRVEQDDCLRNDEINYDNVENKDKNIGQRKLNLERDYLERLSKLGRGKWIMGDKKASLEEGEIDSDYDNGSSSSDLGAYGVRCSWDTSYSEENTIEKGIESDKDNEREQDRNEGEREGEQSKEGGEERVEREKGDVEGEKGEEGKNVKGKNVENKFDGKVTRSGKKY